MEDLDCTGGPQAKLGGREEQFHTLRRRRQGTYRRLAGARREPASLCCAARGSCAARAPLKLAEGGAAATVHMRVALECCGRTGAQPTSAEADQVAACILAERAAENSAHLQKAPQARRRGGDSGALNTSLVKPTPPQGASERSGAAARPPS